MQVKLRLLLADLPAPTDAYMVEVEEGATVEQALAAHLKHNPVEDPHNLLPKSMFIIGKKPAKLDSVLQDQDELLVVRVLGGG